MTFESAGKILFEIHRFFGQKGQDPETEMFRIRNQYFGSNLAKEFRIRIVSICLNLRIIQCLTFKYVLQKYLGCEAILGEPKIYKPESTTGPDYANRQHSALPWSATVQVRI
jgi:hypothetical protein